MCKQVKKLNVHLIRLHIHLNIEQQVSYQKQYYSGENHCYSAKSVKTENRKTVHSEVCGLSAVMGTLFLEGLRFLLLNYKFKFYCIGV